MDKIKGTKIEKMNKHTTGCFEKCDFVDLCREKAKIQSFESTIFKKISEKTCGTISRNFWIYQPTKILKEKRF